MATMTVSTETRLSGARARLEARRRAEERARQRQRQLAQQDGARLMLADAAFYLRRSLLLRAGFLMPFIAAFVIFLAHYTVGGRVYPGVHSLGQHLGGRGQAAVGDALETAWAEQAPLQIYLDNQPIAEATPAQLGMRLDTAATYTQARRVGLAGIPFGFALTPVITVEGNNYLAAQQYLLNFKQQVDIPPANASYRYVNGEVQPVPGQNGRALDIMSALAALSEDPARIWRRGELRLESAVLPPAVSDPLPLLAQAKSVITRGIELVGYDPYTNETTNFSAGPADVANWLEAGPTNLQLQANHFRAMISTINTKQLLRNSNARFLDANYAYRKVNDALARNETRITLRINYRPSIYTVEKGDTTYDIARKNGIPYGLIAEANPGRNLNMLFIGEEIQLPTRDITLPNDVVSHKRIIVDLDMQHLIAYENGEVIFDWGISSGMESDPTLPGVFQILSHTEVANGSSFRLCNDEQCGSWEMHYFMGIYEVRPGLMNGFHGAVLLPNGLYLNGNDVNEPSTLGCVMSGNENAEQLYQWAQQGTIVEIIGDDYLPQSDLARHAQTLINNYYAS